MEPAQAEYLLRNSFDEETSLSLLRQSTAVVTRAWIAYPWWRAIAPSVKAQEGGQMGVVWLIASRAAGFVSNGHDTSMAVYLAQREVGAELRRSYAFSSDELIDFDLIPLSQAPAPSASAVDTLAALWLRASPSERALIQALDEERLELPGARKKAAERVGISARHARRLLASLRKKALSL